MSSKKTNPNTKFYVTIAVMAAIIIAIIASIIWCEVAKNTGDESYLAESGETTKTQETAKKANAENFLELIDRGDAKEVEFTMTDGQKFKMEVYPKVAPATCENFLALVKEGFYDGLTFHRIIDGFMAQGGAFDPVNQANDPAASIRGEFSSNGFENNLSHQRGVVSMARTNDPDSASSQFFICYADASFLDGDYAAFGYVTEGMETVDGFLSAGTNPDDSPKKEVRIEKAEIVE